jgi:hypothetical protein
MDVAGTDEEPDALRHARHFQRKPAFSMEATMKRFGILMLIVFTVLLSGYWLHGQIPNSAPNINSRIPHLSWKPSASEIPRLPRRAEPAILPASGVIWVDCPPEAQYFGAACGTLPVPLDRNHPELATINIYFELYLHTNPGPAESAILVNGTLGGKQVAVLVPQA